MPDPQRNTPKQLVASPEWWAWLAEFRRAEHAPSLSDLIERALIHYAQTKGRPAPPQRLAEAQL